MIMGAREGKEELERRFDAYERELNWRLKSY